MRFFYTFTSLPTPCKNHPITSQWLQTALILKQLNQPRQDALIKSAITSALLLILTQVAVGQSYNAYTATYEATWKAGWFPITIEAKKTLAPIENSQQWKASFEAYSSIADLSEISIFTINKDTIIPQRYQYKTTGFLKKTRRAQRFDWDENKVWLEHQDQWADFELLQNTQDNLTLHEQIRLDVMNGKTEFEYNVSVKGRLKNFTFKVIGKSVLNTKHGDINTIEIQETGLNPKSSNRIWLVPDFDFIILKVQTIKRNGDINTIELKHAQIGERILNGY